MASQLQEALRSLCHKTRWCYAVFWKLKYKILEWEEGFCKPSKGLFCVSSSQTLPSDDCIERAVNKMSYHMYPIGDGIVGQVAFTNIHQWIFSSKDIEHLVQWNEQFAAGIKTIAVVPVHGGVVQLGSTDVTAEDLDFVRQVKTLFFEASQGPNRINTSTVESAVEGTLEEVSHTTPEDATIADLSQVWTTLVARGRHLKEEKCLHAQLHHQNGLHVEEYASSPTHEQQAIHLPSSHRSCTELQPQDLEPCPSPLLHSYELGSNLQWSTPQSSTAHGVAFTNIANERVESFFTAQNINCPIFGVASPDMDFCQQSINTSVTHKRPLNFLQTQINEQFLVPIEVASDVGSNTHQSVGLPYNGFASQACAQGTIVPDTKNSLHQPLTSERNTSLFEDKILSSHSTSSTRNPLEVHTLDLIDSCDIGESVFVAHSHSARNQNTSSLLCGDDVQSSELDEFDTFMASLPKEQDVLSNGVTHLPPYPIHLEDDASELLKKSSHAPSFWDSECSQHTTRRKHVSTRELKEDMSTSCQTFEIDILQMGTRYLETGKIHDLYGIGHGGTSGNMGLPLENSEHKTPHQEFQKLQVGLSTCTRAELPTRSGKKRTRRDEKPTTRPKDRQRIQDRLHELRSIIPSSGKCSIDALLEKTIKYMSFLQTVTEDVAICNDNSKGQVSDVSHSSSDRACGATWAVELGGHGRDCPLFVEDLRQPHHMLVEMLCEKEGFFLEIANTLRGLGLKILKGLMESKDEKMWARLVVKGNKNVHRVQIMWSLMQLLEASTKAASTVTNLACG